MTLRFAQANVATSRCSQCDHDLEVKTQPPGLAKPDPRVFCTNSKCKFSTKPYPMGKQPEAGKFEL